MTPDRRDAELDPHGGDIAFACATALVDALVGGGTPGACISPGSRSTPLALAIARHGGIPVTVHLDERSSAFFALGLAKATGRPALVVTTSGTAVANLLPAVVEASMSRTPLILLTADRPPELRGTGANQTIEQVGIFGVYPRWAVDADPPTAGPGGPTSWGRLGAAAMARALGPPSGPVHLNLPFREPLVPEAVGAGVSAATGPADRARHLEARSSTVEPPMRGGSVDEAAVERLGALFAGTERGIVLVGGLPPWLSAADLRGVAAFATGTGWPVLAEPASNLRHAGLALSAGQHLLADAAFIEAMRPEAVLQVGAPPTSRPAIGVVSAARRLAVVAEDAAGSDPTRSAEVSLSCDPRQVSGFAADAAGDGARSAWTSGWTVADAVVRTALERLLDGLEEPFEGRLARDALAALPAGSNLFAGSSMPIRDLDAYALPGPPGAVRVVANRGASGIDGSVSTTLGISAGDPSAAVTLGLLGDLALLHDAGALLWPSREDSRQRAVFLVANNRGGGIFDHLPVAAVPEHEALFVTPHAVDLTALCAAAGVAYERVERGSGVAGAVRRAATDGTGTTVIEVPVDRSIGLAIRREVREAVRAALAPLGHA